MQSRSETEFFTLSGFIELIEAFGVQNTIIVREHVLKFESAWRNSRDDGDLPSRYHFEHYKGVNEPYRLCHIRVGPNTNYRAVVLFPDNDSKAYWIYAYKKEGQRESRKMENARNRAKSYWAERNKGK